MVLYAKLTLVLSLNAAGLLNQNMTLVMLDLRDVGYLLPMVVVYLYRLLYFAAWNLYCVSIWIPNLVAAYR